MEVSHPTDNLRYKGGTIFYSTHTQKRKKDLYLTDYEGDEDSKQKTKLVIKFCTTKYALKCGEVLNSTDYKGGHVVNPINNTVSTVLHLTNTKGGIYACMYSKGNKGGS